MVVIDLVMSLRCRSGMAITFIQVAEIFNVDVIIDAPVSIFAGAKTVRRPHLRWNAIRVRFKCAVDRKSIESKTDYLRDDCRGEVQFAVASNVLIV